MDVLVLFKRMPAVLALGVTLAAAACAVQLRGADNDASPTQADGQTTGAARSDLARCRSVTSEQAIEFEHCRRIWAENRRRFFGQKAGPADSAGDDPGGVPAVLAPKDQSRMPHGLPSIATPEGNDQ